jgi:hypothetical protein
MVYGGTPHTRVLGSQLKATQSCTEPAMLPETQTPTKHVCNQNYPKKLPGNPLSHMRL